MKSTKIMLAVIACLLTTWTSMSLIGWMLSDASLRECYTHNAVVMSMFIFGWVPSIIIASDLDSHLKDN